MIQPHKIYWKIKTRIEAIKFYFKTFKQIIKLKNKQQKKDRLDGLISMMLDDYKFELKYFGYTLVMLFALFIMSFTIFMVLKEW